MKTKEELTALKEEVETLNKKLAELTEEELAEVSGGFVVHHVGPRVFEASAAQEDHPYDKGILTIPI